MEEKRLSGCKRRAPADEADGVDEPAAQAGSELDGPVMDTQSAAAVDECNGSAAATAAAAACDDSSSAVVSAALHEILVSLFLCDREIRSLSGFPLLASYSISSACPCNVGAM